MKSFSKNQIRNFKIVKTGRTDDRLSQTESLRQQQQELLFGDFGLNGHSFWHFVQKYQQILHRIIPKYSGCNQNTQMTVVFIKTDHEITFRNLEYIRNVI